MDKVKGAIKIKIKTKSLLRDSYEDNIYKDDQNQLILSNVLRCWLAMPLGAGVLS